MSGIKKIARPINNAKNIFLQWLEINKATDIDEYEGEKSADWDYYRSVSGFIGENLYMVYFTIWRGRVNISYSDSEHNYDNIGVDEFLQMIR